MDFVGAQEDEATMIAAKQVIENVTSADHVVNEWKENFQTFNRKNKRDKEKCWRKNGWTTVQYTRSHLK